MPASPPDRTLRPAFTGRLRQNEKLGFGRAELVVGQGTLLVQGRELIQLVGHRGGGRLLVRPGRRLLLLEVANPLVLLVLLLSSLGGSPRDALAGDICTASYCRCAQQRAPSPEHDALLTLGLGLRPGRLLRPGGRPRPRATIGPGSLGPRGVVDGALAGIFVTRVLSLRAGTGNRRRSRPFDSHTSRGSGDHPSEMVGCQRFPAMGDLVVPLAAEVCRRDQPGLERTARRPQHPGIAPARQRAKHR